MSVGWLLSKAKLEIMKGLHYLVSTVPWEWTVWPQKSFPYLVSAVSLYVVEGAFQVLGECMTAYRKPEVAWGKTI